MLGSIRERVRGTLLLFPAALALPAGYTLTLFAGPVAATLGLSPTAVNIVRYWSGAWKDVARRAGVGAPADTD